MIRNFIITSLRILWRNRLVSAINIISLSVGITAFILILLYVHHETSYDKFNENYDRIYRLEGDEFTTIPPKFGDHIVAKLPEIKSMAHMRIEDDPENFFNLDQENPRMGSGIQATVIRADHSIFDVFTLQMLRGDKSSALKQPNTAIITESTAEKLFGEADPIGNIIIRGSQLKKNSSYKVTGIINDIKKSHLKIDILLSEPDLTMSGGRIWKNVTYFLFTKHANSEIVEAKANELLSEVNNGTFPAWNIYKQFHLRPLKDLYLNLTATKDVIGEQGNGSLIWPFIIIAFFVLLLAIINYVNLTTARATLRSKEVIIKKMVGSGKGLLRLQLIMESTIISMISFLIAFTLIQVFLPKFNQLAAIDISLGEFNTPITWIMVLIAALFLGIVSGFYPAIILTSFQSVANIRAQAMSGTRGIYLRRVLLIAQFSISIVLVIAILTNLKQLRYAMALDPGFDKDQILLTSTPGNNAEAQSARKTFKQRILQYPGVSKVAFSSNPTISESENGGALEINGVEVPFQWRLVDPDYIVLMEAEIIEGRNFSWQNESDKSNWQFIGIQTALINETALNEYFSESPVDQIFYRRNFNGKDIALKIIGVVKDIHFQSIHHRVKPTMMTWIGKDCHHLSIKVLPQNLQSTIINIEKEWKEIYNGEPFVYSFLDEEFAAQYENDERAATIIGYFTILALSIACMGLFALSSFMAVRRTKEIGIRKSLGASSKMIFMMLSKDYIKWILLSAVIATPVAWWAMNKWLESFAYRIELGPEVFVIAALLAMAIGLITVGWQALKSAVAKPVDALRYE